MIALLLLVAALAWAGEGTGRNPVAIVSALEGNANALRIGGSTPVKLYDWLTAGTVIELGEQSRLTLVFANGNRYELSSGAKATLAIDRLEPVTGKVRELDPLPPMPKLAAVGGKARSTAAIRLRTGPRRIRNLYPRAGTVTPPDETTLRFLSHDGAPNYRIEVQDFKGSTVFQVQTGSSSVTVPSGILQPGTQYHWEVRALGLVGAVVRGEADFETLGLEDLHRWAALRVRLDSPNDWQTLALLAEIEKRLGMLWEAREVLLKALKIPPSRSALRKLLEELEKELEE